MIIDLVGDFAAVLESMPSTHPRHRILTLLDKAIRRDVHFIERHPTTLFQCLWNTCWWHDCPEVAAHYLDQEKQDAQQQARWMHLSPRLSDLLSTWWSKKKQDGAAPWLRSLRPVGIPLGATQRAVLRGHGFNVYAITYSADGSRLASGGGDKTIRVWVARTGKQQAVLCGHTSLVSDVKFSPDGLRLVSGSRDKSVRIWDARSGAELAILTGHSSEVTSVAFSPDGLRLVSGSRDKSVRIWDARSGAELAILTGHSSEVTSVAFSPDGLRLASAGWGDGTLRIRDANAHMELLAIRVPDGVNSIAFSWNGSLLAAALRDNTVRLWDGASGEEVAVLRGHDYEPTCLSFSQDASNLASGGFDGTIRIWDLGNRPSIPVIIGHFEHIRAVAYVVDGSLIASCSEDKTVRLWSTANGTQLAVLRGHDKPVSAIDFSRDGTLLASGSEDNTVRLWNIRTGTSIFVLRGHDNWVTSVAFSRDGLRLVSSSIDGTVRLWNASTGTAIAVLRGHDMPNAAFSPDGAKLASSSHDGTVRLWDAYTGKEIAVFRGHSSAVTNVTWSPDGSRLASCSRDRTVRVWDPNTGFQLVIMRGQQSVGYGVAFSPDGSRVASDDVKKTYVWDALTGTCLEEIEAHGDLQTIAAGTLVLHRATARRNETIIEDTASGRALAFFPEEPSAVVRHPTLPQWAAYVSNRLYIIALECPIDHTGLRRQVEHQETAQTNPVSNKSCVASSLWYYTIDRRRMYGPVTSAKLKQLIQSGKLPPIAMVSRDKQKWHPATKLRGVNWPDN